MGALKIGYTGAVPVEEAGHIIRRAKDAGLQYRAVQYEEMALVWVWDETEESKL